MLHDRFLYVQASPHEFQEACILCIGITICYYVHVPARCRQRASSDPAWRWGLNPADRV